MALCCTTSPSRGRAPVSEDGRTTFMGHDMQGASIAVEILARLRASRAPARSRGRPDSPSPPARVSRAPRCRSAGATPIATCATCEPVEVDVTRAQRRRPPGHPGTELRASRSSVTSTLARELMGEALAWPQRAAAPAATGRRSPPASSGMAGGPELGRLLAELEQAAYAEGSPDATRRWGWPGGCSPPAPRATDR